MARTGEDPEAIVREEGLVQLADSDTLSGVVEEVVARHPQAVVDFREGKRQSLGFLVGQVMKATHGKANPQLVNQLLLERLAPPA